jgi:hypothetical protein
MRHFLCVFLLLVAVAAVGQQQQPPGPPVPGTTPPTFPDDKNPSKQMPPDTAAPPPAAQPTSGEVQQQINEKLAQEPGLKGSNVRFDVDDHSVVIGGTVADEQQHDLALRLARSYAGDRKIVDYVKVLPAR